MEILILTVDVMRVPGAPGEAIFSVPVKREEGRSLYEFSLGPEWELIKRNMRNRGIQEFKSGQRCLSRALPGSAQEKGGTETGMSQRAASPQLSTTPTAEGFL